MTHVSAPGFGFPAVSREKVTAAFDGGRISSDGGVMLLAAAERRLGLADRLAAPIADPRNPARTIHSMASLIRARIFAICCGYEDCDDLNDLREDPAFKLACGQLPDGGYKLCSQPTLSRFENQPSFREILAPGHGLINICCSTYTTPPEAVILRPGKPRRARNCVAICAKSCAASAADSAACGNLQRLAFATMIVWIENWA
ncbi:MAG: transposase [Hyphomicrobiales bacterium]|nr:transposase [Hyphomicrobiales bacterium]MDE2114580.1 transposase [Hyphomicrobiales bacterium]